MSNWSSTKISTLSPITSINGATGAVSITAAGLGAASTSHTHAASDISSGTIATARLASGTANSTTYLRGDQTWATVSGGDTTYSQTVQDCENTAANTTIIAFNVPGSTWQYGEYIDIFIHYQVRNLTGSNQTLTTGLYIGGSLVGSAYAATVLNNFQYFGFGVVRLIRDGEQIKWASFGTDTSFGVIYGPSFTVNDTTQNISAWTNSHGPNFLATQGINLRTQFSVANPSLFLRIFSSRVVKYAGQAT